MKQGAGRIPTEKKTIMTQIQKMLFEMQDAEYRKFQAKLMPTVDIESIIGVRTPELRRLAKTVKNESYVQAFLDELPHKYYDENNLHSFIICEEKNIDVCIDRIDKFLPFVDNWATCDQLSPKIFKKNTDRLLAKIFDWMQSDKTYTVRFAVEMLMNYFLDERFEPSQLELASTVESDEYYIKMMQAWYYATALAKQYDTTLGFLKKNTLPVWTHNKTIQKARESYRITDEQKEYLNTLKR